MLSGAGTERHYRVSATSSLGTGVVSEEASATTDPAMPGAPTFLTVLPAPTENASPLAPAMTTARAERSTVDFR